MPQNQYRHRDCRQFAPVDVAKGLCHRTKEMVSQDDGACAFFDRIPKCGWCLNFRPDPAQTHLGVCEASPHEPKFAAYPDMVAVTCESYREQ